MTLESDFFQIDSLNVDRKSVPYGLKYFKYQGLKPYENKMIYCLMYQFTLILTKL